MNIDNLKAAIEQIIILMEMAYIEPGTFNFRGYTIVWNHEVCDDHTEPKDKINFSYLITGNDLAYNIFNTSSIDFNDSEKYGPETKIFHSIPGSDFVDVDKRYMKECVDMLEYLGVSPAKFCWSEYEFSWKFLGNDILMVYCPTD